MTPSDFTRRTKALGLRSQCLPACKDVLVRGISINKAAKAHGVDIPQTAKLVKRIRTAELCRSCGQPL